MRVHRNPQRRHLHPGGTARAGRWLGPSHQRVPTVVVRAKPRPPFPSCAPSSQICSRPNVTGHLPPWTYNTPGSRLWKILRCSTSPAALKCWRSLLRPAPPPIRPLCHRHSGPAPTLSHTGLIQPSLLWLRGSRRRCRSPLESLAIKLLLPRHQSTTLRPAVCGRNVIFPTSH
jgi:hypothetical protein